MRDLFVGIDTGQTNQGIAIIDSDLKILELMDTGVKFPKNKKGRNVPDIIKNAYVYYETKSAVYKAGYKNIKMAVLEGANYSAQSNVTPISIGSIHGQNQMFFWDHQIDFMILPPRMIQVGIHDTSIDITKQKTKDKMRQLFGDQIPQKGFTSNMSDALGMAYLARQFYLLMTGSVTLSVGQQKIFLSASKRKNSRRGLIYNFGSKVFIFDKNHQPAVPNEGETLKTFYIKTKE